MTSISDLYFEEESIQLDDTLNLNCDILILKDGTIELVRILKIKKEQLIGLLISDPSKIIFLSVTSFTPSSNKLQVEQLFVNRTHHNHSRTKTRNVIITECIVNK